MNEQNAKYLHAYIVEKGNSIHDKLPAHHAHPDGRIGIAHIYSVIKLVMGVPMKQCRDVRMSDIIEIVDYCVTNVNASDDLTAPLLLKYTKEPVYAPRSLDEFM